MAANTTLTAARGTILSIILRLTSFLLSQLTVRFVSAAALGKASIPLELLLSTSLFVGREGFRLALTKELGETTAVGTANDDSVGDENKDNQQQHQQQQRLNDKGQRIINVSWLSIPTGALLSCIALLLHLQNCNNQQHDDESDYYASFDYKLAGVLYCLASFIESCSEPLVIRCLQSMDVTTKAKAEGAALILKSISCFGCLCVSQSNWFFHLLGVILEKEDWVMEGNANNVSFAVTAFGVSQLVYAIVFTTIMYRKARSSSGGIYWPKNIMTSTTIHNPYRGTPKHIKEGACASGASTTPETEKTTSSRIQQNFDLHTLYLVLIFTLQGLFKHALTEADKIVLSALAGSYDQGVYALAASYGGLAARLLLQPVEENARLLFSRQGALLVAQQHHDVPEDNNTNSNKDEKKDGKKSTNGFKLLKELEDAYFFLMRVVLYIGLVFAAIATNYTSVLLRLLAGSRWGMNVEASAALSAL